MTSVSEGDETSGREKISAGIGLADKVREIKIFQLRATFQIVCPSYHLPSWWKSTLIQKLSAQIPKALYQHGIVKKILLNGIHSM